MFVELDTRQTDGLTVSLEWDRATDDTQVVVYDSRSAIEVAFWGSWRKCRGCLPASVQVPAPVTVDRVGLGHLVRDGQK